MADSRKTEATVLVTGFGPFMQFPINASYEIANSLPSKISPSADPRFPLRQINIVVHRPAIRTSYHDVRTELPDFYAAHPEADLVLHLGQAYPRDFYTIETRSFREEYNTFVDEDGCLARDLRDLPGGENLWRDVYHAPERLETAVQPVGELWRRTQSLLLGKESEADVRLSINPGNFCCGFIYYAGLVERWRKGEEQNVLFLHTKGETDDDTLAEGREVALAVIRAAVEMLERYQWREDGEQTEGMEDERGCKCVVL